MVWKERRYEVIDGTAWVLESEAEAALDRMRTENLQLHQLLHNADCVAEGLEQRVEIAEAKLAAAEAPYLAALKCRDNAIASLEAEVERLKAPCNACAFKAMRLPEEPARPVVKRGRKYCESCSWFGDCADGNKSRYACLDYVERQPAPPARGFGLEEALKKRRRKA